MRSAWRRRCPRGHAALKGRNGDYYYCEPCDQRYSGAPLDAANHDFPVDNIEERALPETPQRQDVLVELVRRCREGRAGLKAREMQAGPSASVAAHLAQLRERGLVERRDRALGSNWRPTDKGRDVAQSDGLNRDSQGQILAGCQP